MCTRYVKKMCVQQVNVWTVLIWFFRTTNQAQLFGFWTPRSSLDFVLWWWLLCCLPRCTTETRLEKNVFFWGYAAHIWQLINIPGWSCSVGVLVLVLLLEQFWCPAPVSWSSLKWSFSVVRWMQHLNYHIPEVESKKFIHSQSSIVGSHLCDECNEVILSKRLSQAWVLFVTARASLFTEHRISGLQIRAKYKHGQDNLWAYVGQFSNWFKLFLFWIDDHPLGNFVELLHFFVCRLTVSFSAFLSMSFPFRRTHATVFAWGCVTLETFQLLQQKFVIRTLWLYSSIMISFGLDSCWVHPKCTWTRNEVRSSISTFVVNFFHMGAIFCFLPAMFDVHHFNRWE